MILDNSLAMWFVRCVVVGLLIVFWMNSRSMVRK